MLLWTDMALCWCETAASEFGAGGLRRHTMSIDAVVGFWQALEQNVNLREQVDFLGAIEPGAPDQAFEPLSRLANEAVIRVHTRRFAIRR